MIPVKKIILTAGCVFSIIAITIPVLIYAFRTANIKDFPSLSGKLINGDIFFSTDIDISKNTVIVFFSPDCNYCKTEIEAIKDIDPKLHNTQWLFLTASDIEETIAFAKDNELNRLKYSLIVILDDPSPFVQFKISSPPAAFLYNAKGKYIAGCKDTFNLNHFIKFIEKWDKRR